MPTEGEVTGCLTVIAAIAIFLCGFGVGMATKTERWEHYLVERGLAEYDSQTAEWRLKIDAKPSEKE